MASVFEYLTFSFVHPLQHCEEQPSHNPVVIVASQFFKLTTVQTV